MTFLTANSEQERRMKLEQQAIAVWQSVALQRGLLRSCVNCINFQKSTEGCLIAQGQRPPAMVIVLGCNRWEDDIPF